MLHPQRGSAALQVLREAGVGVSVDDHGTGYAPLAHDLGLHLVAEGIETQDVIEALAALGRDRGQGHHVARPVPRDELLRWFDAAMVTPHAADPDVVTPAAAPASWGSPGRPWTGPDPPTGGSP